MIVKGDKMRIKNREYKWTHWNLNIHFMRLLAEFELEKLKANGWDKDEDVTATVITLAEAYEIYAEHCAQRPYRRTDNHGNVYTDNWMEMNARSHIACAAYRGVMEWVAPGMYTFQVCGAYDFLMNEFGSSRYDFPRTHKEFLIRGGR